MDLQQLIDDYLQGNMSPEDRKLFENLIEAHPRYKSDLASKKKGKEAIQLLEKHFRTKNSLVKSWGLPAVIALGLVLASYLLWISLAMSPGEKLFKKHFAPLPGQVDTVILGGSHSDLKTLALQAYQAKDFAKAAAFFEQIPFDSQSDFLVLYQGICQLELQRPEKAIPLFKLIKPGSSSASAEVAAWFAALGYFKLDMLEEAKKSLRLTAASANPYQNQAQEILKSLE